MKLYLSGHPYRYAVEQMMLTVFPQDRPEFVETVPQDGNFAILELRETKRYLYGLATVCIDGRQETAKTKLENSDDALLYKRNAQQALKLAFYRAARPFLKVAPPWGAMTGIRPAKLAARLYAEGNDDAAVDRILKQSYHVVKRRRELCCDVAKVGQKIKAENRAMDASVYVGIPFCVSRCKYCSFVSHSIGQAAHLVEPYLDALFLEMKAAGKAARDIGLNIKTVYVGGGTPTALSAEQLDRVLSHIRASFDLSGCVEFTVEAGRPDTMDIEKLAVIERNGATRISVNPQTMNDRVLELIGRNHTAQDVVDMVHTVRETTNLAINMDLIAGLPGDTDSSFYQTVRAAMQLDPENITVHTLALKKGATLWAERLPRPNGDEVLRMVDYAAKKITADGYHPYYLYRQKYMSGNLENVGYTKPGFEGLYNVYIMEEIHTILSMGAGGVSKLVAPDTGKLTRIFNLKYPYEYHKDLARLEANADEIRAFYQENFAK